MDLIINSKHICYYWGLLGLLANLPFLYLCLIFGSRNASPRFQPQRPSDQKKRGQQQPQRPQDPHWLQSTCAVLQWQRRPTSHQGCADSTPETELGFSIWWIFHKEQGDMVVNIGTWCELNLMGYSKKLGEWIEIYGFLMIFDMEVGRIKFWIQIQIRLKGTKHIGMNLKGEAELETLCIHIAGCCKWSVADRIHATPVGSIVYFQTSNHL